MSKHFQPSSFATRAQDVARRDAAKPAKGFFDGCIVAHQDRIVESRGGGFRVVEYEAYYDRRTLRLVGLRHPETNTVELVSPDTGSPTSSQPAAVVWRRRRSDGPRQETTTEPAAVVATPLHQRTTRQHR